MFRRQTFNWYEFGIGVALALIAFAVVIGAWLWIRGVAYLVKGLNL